MGRPSSSRARRPRSPEPDPRSSRDLKIDDPACGTGGFLVGACGFSAHIVQPRSHAWLRAFLGVLFGLRLVANFGSGNAPEFSGLMSKFLIAMAVKHAFPAMSAARRARTTQPRTSVVTAADCLPRLWSRRGLRKRGGQARGTDNARLVRDERGWPFPPMVVDAFRAKHEVGIETASAAGETHRVMFWIVAVDGVPYGRSVRGPRSRWWLEHMRAPRAWSSSANGASPSARAPCATTPRTRASVRGSKRSTSVRWRR